MIMQRLGRSRMSRPGLCDEAKPGHILISPRVMLAVDKTVTVELVGEFNLKGIRRPMAAYNVLAPSISKPN